MSADLYIKCLKENYDAYVKTTTDERKERKRMTNNYQDNVQTQITEEAQMALDNRNVVFKQL